MSAKTFAHDERVPNVTAVGVTPQEFGEIFGSAPRAVRLVSPAFLRVHPSASLVPDMRAGEYAELLADIRQRGILTPLDVLGEVVLDGRHRLRAASELGIKRVPVLEALVSQGGDVEYLLKAALLRRHLTDDQRAMVAAQYAKNNPKPRGGDRRSPAASANIKLTPAGNIDRTPGRSAAAQRMNVSVSRVKKAAALLSSAPKLAQAVHRGDVKLGAALRSVQRAQQLLQIEATPLPRGIFRTLVIDPPWPYDDTQCKGAASHIYPSMTWEQIRALPVKELGAADSHLFLWVPNPHLELAFQLVRQWGYDYKTLLTWVKSKLGLGRYFRGCTEQVLFCTRGSLPLREQNLRNYFEAPNKAHSEKPELFYQLVEKASHGPYLEMFARRAHEGEGWTCWGAEVGGLIHQPPFEVKPEQAFALAGGLR